MIDDRERRNDLVVAEHKAARARGEKRVLRTTRTGELHSYAADEIGFTPGHGQPQVSTWWGMGIVTAFLGLLFVFSWGLLLAPVAQGGDPFWGALALAALSGALGWYSFRLTREELRAARRRKERGVPRPGTSGSLPPGIEP